MQTLASRLSLPAAALLVSSVITVMPTASPPAALSAPVAPSVARTLYIPDIELTATVGDIFEFPAFRQFVVNEVVEFLILVDGLGDAGAAAVQAILAVPSNLVLITQQILARDLLGALDTIETELVEVISTIGTPLVNAAVERRQRALAVDEALQAAIPAALIGISNSLLDAFDTVARASIIAGQAVVDSVFPLGFGNVIGALIDGIGSVLQSFVVAGGQVVDGIVLFQQTIAEALKAKPGAEEEAPGALATARSLDVGALPKTGTTAVTLDTTDTTVTDKDIAAIADDGDTPGLDNADDTAVQLDSDVLTDTQETTEELTDDETLAPSVEPEDDALTDDELESAPVTADQPGAGDDTATVPSSDPVDADPSTTDNDDTDDAGNTGEDTSTTD